MPAGPRKPLGAFDQPVFSVTEETDNATVTNVTTVLPTGDCALNASAIQDALNAAQPGDVVQKADREAFLEEFDTTPLSEDELRLRDVPRAKTEQEAQEKVAEQVELPKLTPGDKTPAETAHALHM